MAYDSNLRNRAQLGVVEQAWYNQVVDKCAGASNKCNLPTRDVATFKT